MLTAFRRHDTLKSGTVTFEEFQQVRSAASTPFRSTVEPKMKSAGLRMRPVSFLVEACCSPVDVQIAGLVAFRIRPPLSASGVTNRQNHLDLPEHLASFASALHAALIPVKVLAASKAMQTLGKGDVAALASKHAASR